ncbi:hypothetical protein FLAPXU55_00665 [Flavobacterium panici]|uniref:Uncharacterized protein n=1 Tax=Flavobacterium panici TaxID=2654843 RepID=A0A9N8J021_9FLAO|nr:hypothetical protein FLAPXU55_00665 [Flavobacterium panici]
MIIKLEYHSKLKLGTYMPQISLTGYETPRRTSYRYTKHYYSTQLTNKKTKQNANKTCDKS